MHSHTSPASLETRCDAELQDILTACKRRGLRSRFTLLSINDTNMLYCPYRFIPLKDASYNFNVGLKSGPDIAVYTAYELNVVSAVLFDLLLWESGNVWIANRLPAPNRLPYLSSGKMTISTESPTVTESVPLLAWSDRRASYCSWVLPTSLSGTLNATFDLLLISPGTTVMETTSFCWDPSSLFDTTSSCLRRPMNWDGAVKNVISMSTIFPL
mmetsp:Transcript_24066/g.45693  ORF Transcript_24066/g.45693 Transcript_24066/m.45693 type:complete len:214 (-) Transcript_24066:747-1388(-)